MVVRVLREDEHALSLEALRGDVQAASVRERAGMGMLDRATRDGIAAIRSMEAEGDRELIVPDTEAAPP